jgi:hypothetical protein
MKGTAKAVTDVMMAHIFKFETFKIIVGLHLRNVVLRLGQCASVRWCANVRSNNMTLRIADKSPFY